MDKTLIFSKRKGATLSKSDLSKKGSVDFLIKDLVGFINDQPHYYTTSCCSGRIILISDSFSSPAPQKKNCKWFLTSHQQVSHVDLLNVLSGVKECSKLKFEPFIMHVQCLSIEHAHTVLKSAIVTGFKNSGITFGKNCKNPMVAVRATLCLEIPLTGEGGIRLTSDEYVEHITNIANIKMKNNEDRIIAFEKCFRSSVCHNSKLEKKIKVNRYKSTKLKTDPEATKIKENVEELFSDACFLFNP